MTDETPQSAAPASTPPPAAPSEPAGRPNLQVTPAPAAPDNSSPPVQQGDKPQEGEAKVFTLPDAYKEKGWAGKVKSEDDLYKLVDNLDQAVGKKAALPDFAKATPEELESFYAKTRPADVKAYDFEGMPDEMKDPVSKIFYDYGIPPDTAKKIAAAYNGFETQLLADASSEQGWKDAMKTSFGDASNDVVKTVTSQHKQHLSADDQKLMDALPNDQLALVYRLTNAMAKAYGASDTPGAHAAGAGAVPKADLETVRAGLRKQIAEIDARPHTQEERQKLINDLDKTYR